MMLQQYHPLLNFWWLAVVQVFGLAAGLVVACASRIAPASLLSRDVLASARASGRDPRLSLPI